MEFEIWERSFRETPVLSSIDKLFAPALTRIIVVKSLQDKLTIEGYQLIYGSEARIVMWYWGISLRPYDHGVSELFYMFDPRAEVRDADEL